MQISQFQELLNHMEWADAAIWKSVLALPPERQGGPMLERLHHLHTVQWVYLQMLRGEPPEFRELASFAGAAAVAAWVRDFYQQLHPFAGALTAERLSRTLAIPWAAEVAKRYGSAAPATMAEGVLQVVLHSTHHRAQVATFIREAGSEAQVTDFIAWVWQGKPGAAW